MPRNKFWVKSIAFTLFVLIIGMGSINITSKTIEKRNDASIWESSIPYPFKDPPNEVWNKTFGGSNSEYGWYIQQTGDNGYIIVGSTHSYGAGEGDIWLIKTDIDGNELWNKTYGGPYSDWGSCVRETNDGGFIISGGISSSDNYFDTWLIKTDSNGNIIWDKTFSRTDADGSGDCVIEIDDGFLIMSELYYNSGPKNNDIWLIKTDIDGNEQWNKLLGDDNFDYGNAVIQATGGDFVIVGYASYNLVLLIKTDSDGDILWRTTLDGDEGHDIKECSDGGYIIAGEEHVCLIRTDKDGNVQWKKEYDWFGFDRAYSVDITSDGGYILTGSGTYYQGDMLIIKTDKDGNREWEKLIVRPAMDSGFCVIQSNDGTYVIVGRLYIAGQYDVWLVKVAPFENQRPKKPSKPVGPTRVRVFNEYNYSSSAYDPDGELVFYRWENSDFYGFYGPFNNNDVCEIGFGWISLGKDNLVVKARDNYGGDSEWSDPLEVTVTLSRNRIMPDSLLMNLIERFPLLDRLLSLVRV